MLASDFHFRFDSRSGKFQTAVGGYMTLMMMVICLAALSTAMMQYFQKKDPVVSNSREAGPIVNEFNMYENTLWTPGSFAIGPSWLTTDVISKMTTVVWVMEEKWLNKTTNKFQKRVVRSVPAIPCSQITDPLIRKYIDISVAVPKFEEIVLCPDLKDDDGSKEDFMVSEDLENHAYRTMSMRYYPCSLPNPANCLKREQMLVMRIDMMRINKLLKSYDYEEPVFNLYYRGFFTIDIKATKFIKRTVMRAKVIDDISRFSPPTLKLEYIKLVEGKLDFKLRDENQLHCSKALIEAGGCQPYLSFDYSAYSEVEIHYRDYMKFTTLLGELGGLLKIFTTVVFLAYPIYNYREMKGFISRAVVNIDDGLVDRLRALVKKDRKEEGPSGTSSELSSHPEKKKKEPIGVEKAAKQFVKERITTKFFFKRLNSLELIENSLFTDYERKLIPLVLLKIYQKKNNNKTNKNRKKESFDEINPNDHHLRKRISLELLQVSISSFGRQSIARENSKIKGEERQERSVSTKMNSEDKQEPLIPDRPITQRIRSIHKAYKKLKNSQNCLSDQIRSPVQKYMLGLLNDLFKESGDQCEIEPEK